MACNGNSYPQAEEQQGSGTHRLFAVRGTRLRGLHVEQVRDDGRPVFAPDDIQNSCLPGVCDPGAVMSNERDDTRTELTTTSIDYNVGLKEEDFSRRQLETVSR